MRIAALILGILGSLIVFGIGALWTENADHLKEVEDMEKMVAQVSQEAARAGAKPTGDEADMKRMVAVVKSKAAASYPMVGCAFVAFLASLLAVKLPKVSGAIMAAAVVIPAFFYWVTLFVSFVLALAAILALLARPKVKAPKAAAAAAA
jgi:hypothetical protein